MPSFANLIFVDVEMKYLFTDVDILTFYVE